MHVAYVCLDPGVPIFGSKGCSVHAQETIREMRRQSIRVTLFASRLGGVTPSGLEDVDVHELHVSQSDAEARERSIIESNRTIHDRLHGGGPFDFVYERYSLLSCSAMEFARKVDIPGLLEVNSPLIEEQLQHRRLLNLREARNTTKLAFSAASSLLPVSEEVGQFLLEFPVPAARIEVIPNGVDPGRFTEALSSSGTRSTDVFTIGFVGTLKPWHGVSTLIDAFSTLARHQSGRRLLIVGDGPERAHLEEQVAQLGIDTEVEFTGAVLPEQIPQLLARMDVAVAPYPASNSFYFSPLKLFEYMAAEIPVVASRIGQISRILTHEVNGLLCQPGHSQELVAAIERLRSDAGLRNGIAAAGRNCVLREHTWQKVVERIVERARHDSLERVA